jgi:hypothetical protein
MRIESRSVCTVCDISYSTSVWSEQVHNNVSKWLAGDVCILHGITEIKH